MRVRYGCCPLCEATGFTHVKDVDCTSHSLYHADLPGTLTWLECVACGHVYTDGYWSDEANALLLGAVSDPMQIFNPKTMEALRDVASPMVDRVLMHRGLPRDDAWLDIGFGNGALLFAAEEYGFKPVGIDVRQDVVDRLKRIGANVHCCGIQEFEHEPVSVVSMADVLEHVPFPKEALGAVRRLLRDDGLLFVSCPAYKAPVWQLMDAKGDNGYWMEIEHYHNFTRERLFALLKETGFEPLSYGIGQRYRAGMEVVARAA